MTTTNIKRGRHCSACGDPDHDRRQCPKLPASRSSNSRGRPFDPWLDLEWEEHTEARKIVAENPDGMTLEQIGSVLGVTRERVRQIEASAMRKLRDGTDLADTVELDGQTIAMVQCHDCFAFFPREGRRKFCDEHAHLEKSPPRPRLAAVTTPEPVAAPVVALPTRKPARGPVRRPSRRPSRRPAAIGNAALAVAPEPQQAEELVVELPILEFVLDLEGWD